MAGCAKTIQINLGVTEVAELPASFVKIHGATKIRILFFYPSTVGYSQEEENRQSEKLRLTLNILREQGFKKGTVSVVASTFPLPKSHPV
jgi:hypothetical protein